MTTVNLPFPPEFARQQVFEDIQIPLAVFFRQLAMSNVSIVEGRAFRRCKIEGPAVMLVLDGVAFEGCNMGFDGGDVRNLLLRPMGKKVIGSVPFAMCLFENCSFNAVGFTGEDRHLEAFQSALSGVQQ
ncbi:hypothetical protein [Brevundimonas vesicularis]|uniref:hypothetical protein n=1 Tax=Brevundimonas vesicularis TaxID=41276 RepID=UPI0022AC0FBC|nr:hypothetical protein [Brevundimonas vesicularis]